MSTRRRVETDCIHKNMTKSDQDKENLLVLVGEYKVGLVAKNGIYDTLKTDKIILAEWPCPVNINGIGDLYVQQIF
jgi:hypothetical protein